MNKNDVITNLQQARAIINTPNIGEHYHRIIIDKLRATFWDMPSGESELKANSVLQNMEKEYVLNVANVLWKDKFDLIPQYIKNWETL